MKKFLLWLLILVSLSALIIRFSDFLAAALFGINPVSGISVLTMPSDATVYLDDKEVGKTPYTEKNLKVQDYTVRIEKDNASWQGKIRLIPGTITVINRDIASDSASSAGETVSLDKGKGLTVVSHPAETEVEIDGKSFGKTPLKIDIELGGHNITISRTGYLNRSIRVELPKDYNMTVAVDLALSEVDLTTIQTPVITKTLELVVKNTPTGFLRMREKPTTNSREITRVKPGDTIILLEEQQSWDRVRLSDGTEGYVSSVYVEKKNP